MCDLSLSPSLPPSPPVTWVMLVLNVLVSIVGAAVANDNDRNEFLTTMGVSVLYLVLFVPGTLFCWFLPAYHAYRWR